MIKKGKKVKVIMELGEMCKVCQVSEKDYKTGKITSSGIYLYLRGKKQPTRYKNYEEACEAAPLLISKFK